VAGLIDALRGQGIEVGDNEPYDGRVAMGYTLEHHAIPRGLPHVLIEIRNDLIRSSEGQGDWAMRIAQAMTRCGMAPMEVTA
jgi:predicted N-formylglutamate amidohydrolase